MANEETTPLAEETAASEDAPATDATTEDTTADETTEAATVESEEAEPEEAQPETVEAEAPEPEAAEAETSEPEEAQPATAEAVEPELNTSLAPAEGASAGATRAEVPGGRNYETIFIVRVGQDPNAVTERIRGLIEQSGGGIDNVRISELRRLAYPIKKQIEGVYVVLNGRFTKETAAELDRVFKIDEAVLRHMTVREDQ